MAFIFGKTRLYEFTLGGDGMYSLYVRPARPGQDSSVPEFVRPSALIDQDSSQTTAYHTPTIQTNHNGQECVIMDRATMQTAASLIKAKGEPMIFLFA
jgi:hypothetical protein